MAQGEPGSAGPARSELFLPFRAVVPIGCTGGGETMSKPIAAIASSLRAAVAKVPETGSVLASGSTWAPSDLGKYSYQELKSARWRWTRSGHQAEWLSRSRT